MGIFRRFRHQMDADLAQAVEDLRDWFDKAADAAMLEPGAPQITAPREPEKPRDIMGGSSA